MRFTLRFTVLALAAAAIAAAVVAGAARSAGALAAPGHNPCEFLDPAKPQQVVKDDTLFTTVIGKYSGFRAVHVEDVAGPDFQDGICTVTGGPTYAEPASDCGGKSPCSPVYGELLFAIHPADEMFAQLADSHVEVIFPSRRHISGAGPNGTVACDRPGTGCAAWFTKGSKFVLITESNLHEPKSQVLSGTTYVNIEFGKNGSADPRRTLELAADIAYDHASPWSTAEKPH